jgi:hypothetical protein
MYFGSYIAIINAYFPKKINAPLYKSCYNFNMAKKKTASERKKIRIEVVKQMLTLSTSAFGLVAALAWNSVIQEFVNSYVKKWLPSGSGIISLLIYAVIVTLLAVFVTLQLSRLSERLSEK